jgi:hypothetical protein
MPLIRIPVSALNVDASHRNDSEWDRLTDSSDLTEYVKVSGAINATPSVRFDGGGFDVVSGAPFVEAAQESQGKVTAIVCWSDEEFTASDFLGVELVDVRTLLPFGEYVDSTEMISFFSSLENEKRHIVEAELREFSGSLGSARDGDCISPRCIIESSVWRRNNEVCLIRLRHRTFCDPDLLELTARLRKINSTIAAIRSVNGMRWELFGTELRLAGSPFRGR